MNDYKDNVESQILTVGEGSEKYGIEEGEEEFCELDSSCRIEGSRT